MRSSFFIIIGLVFLFACKPSAKLDGSEKGIEATLTKLKLKSIKQSDAEAMIKHALDENLERDWSMGRLSAADLRVLTENAAFQRVYIIRANDLKTHEAKTIAAFYFAPSEDTPPGQSTIRYAEITVCPPPDGSTCLKDYLDI